MTSSPRVAFQGAPGAFGEEAVLRWRADAQPEPRGTFAAVLDAVVHGEADAAVLPVENRIAGLVAEARAALGERATLLRVVGEVTQPIALCLLALPGATTATVRVVRSHPVALAQCGAFLRAHPDLVAEPWWDTAGAARDVARAGDPAVGALASRLAAERWGLVVLAAEVQDLADNWTRFVVVTRRAERADASDAASGEILPGAPGAGG
ncbi:prephenate dehydratase domain-containing protein [Roseisolibacter agri]|nr:prephenate dehydratase domain-containing protein [Roseisolibacter agri]